MSVERGSPVFGDVQVEVKCVEELRFGDRGDRSEDDDAAVNENVRARYIIDS